MASFISNSIFWHFSANWASPIYFFMLITFLLGGLYAKARARAEIKVFSAAPVFRFFSSHLTIYLLSSFEASCNILTMIPSFSAYELFPDDLPIFLKASNTCLNVSPAFGSAFFLVKNDPRVFYVDFPNWTTRPRSPSFLNYSLIYVGLLPQALATDFSKISCPMPVSMPS
jgi:hypothetical protein